MWWHWRKASTTIRRLTGCRSWPTHCKMLGVTTTRCLPTVGARIGNTFAGVKWPICRVIVRRSAVHGSQDFEREAALLGVAEVDTLDLAILGHVGFDNSTQFHVRQSR